MTQRESDLGVRLKDLGQKQALASSGPEWGVKALEALRTFAMKTEVFTADQFRAYCEELDFPDPVSSGAWGALFTTASMSRGYIRKTGQYEASLNPVNHAHSFVLWESLIFEGMRKRGGPKSPTTRWALKAKGQPALVFVERPTALDWIQAYADMMVVKAEEVEIRRWTVQIELSDEPPGPVVPNLATTAT